ncbi:MAG: selenocysteine-specific translation elongation factor [Rubrivivax sp.]|nr:selenocysteine-specific translation elongation factor [Rubrivivax sp.]
MILAVAGHVDHGKTTLVRALTGVDTDRLPEERRRGMSIEPGFAPLALADGRCIDVVDLPGHAGWLRQALAGMAAADAALLVVAADDGPMPQTDEHAAALALLQVPLAAVAITKVDRVDPERLAALHAELAQRWPAVPQHAVVAATGQGLDTLRARLQALPARCWNTAGAARFWVDRAFAAPGVGTVATGTLVAGRLALGDSLLRAPDGPPVRVRGLQRHGRAVASALAGDRCALALAGVEVAQLARGDALVAPGLAGGSRRIDVRLQAGDDAAPVGEWQLHLGTAVQPVRLAAGPGPFARVLLPRPLPALRGDRLLLRDPATRRLQGGEVIDPDPPPRGRRSPVRLQALQAAAEPDARAALAALLLAQPDGVHWPGFVRCWNLGDGADALRQAVPHHAVADGDGLRLLAPDTWQRLLDAVDQALARQHAAEPQALGVDEAQLHRLLQPPVPPRLAQAALRQRVADGAVRRTGPWLALAGHVPEPDAADQALMQRLQPVLDAPNLRPPPLGELAALLGLPVPEAEAQLLRLARRGHLVRVARKRYFLPHTLQALEQRVHETAAAAPDGVIEPTAFRDRSGVGRNLSIELLEHFDRRGLTRLRAGRRTLRA